MPRKCRKCGQAGVFRRIKREGRFHCTLHTCNACIAKSARAWRKTRTKKQIDRNKAYMRRYRPLYRKRRPSRVEGTRAWAKRNPERRLYKSMIERWRAAKQFTARMTFPEFIEEIGGRVPKRCPVLGIKLFGSNGAFAAASPSVDRINPKRPYQKGNIAVISYRANALKNNGTAAEHRRIADWMDAMAARRKRPSKKAA